MIADALEHLVRGIVDSPEDVDVRARSNRRGELLELCAWLWARFPPKGMCELT